jgi:hypothetical protein
MKRTFFSDCLLALPLLFMTACSSAPPAPKAPKKAPEPVTGQSGIFQMYLVAKTWAPDAMLLKLENGNIPETAPQPGKSGLWRATFVSQTKKVKRDYQFAAADSDGGIIKGARAGSESMYALNPQVHPFAIQEVKADTPVALEAAMDEVEKDKDMKKVLAENKDLPVQFLLEWTGTAAKPTWRVIYGPSISASKFSIFIDANTGKYVKKLR